MSYGPPRLDEGDVECPACHSIFPKAVAGVPHDASLYRCRACGGLFDDDPNEGGDHDDRDPSRRIKRREASQAIRRSLGQRFPIAESRRNRQVEDQ